MTKRILTVISLLFSIVCFSQPEYEQHIESIRKSTRQKLASDFEYQDSTLLDFALREIIQPGEEIYISDRALLTSLKMTYCSQWYVEFNGVTSDSLQLSVVMGAQKFDTLTNKVEKFKEENWSDFNEKINGRLPYGGVFSIPKRSIASLEISVGGKKIKIPESVYSNLYDANFCEFGGFTRKLEVYTSMDGRFIYVYIYGGEAAGTYFAKLIFNHEKFLAKWVLEYGPLSIYGSFSESFIGF